MIRKFILIAALVLTSAACTHRVEFTATGTGANDLLMLLGAKAHETIGNVICPQPTYESRSVTVTSQTSSDDHWYWDRGKRIPRAYVNKVKECRPPQ